MDRKGKISKKQAKALQTKRQYFKKDSAFNPLPVLKVIQKNIALILLIAVLATLALWSFPKCEFKEKTSSEPSAYAEDLEKFRNMSAEEILKQLNIEKGFAEPEEAHELKEFNITAGRYQFTPNIINVKLNDLVKLNVFSIDQNHVIRIPGFFISRRIQAGNFTVVEFIASKKGEYVFDSALNKEMTGKIVIE
jgi:heme/copper-type cytochrome/quinol oxidase subunit 2